MKLMLEAGNVVAGIVLFPHSFLEHLDFALFLSACWLLSMFEDLPWEAEGQLDPKQRVGS